MRILLFLAFVAIANCATAGPYLKHRVGTKYRYEYEGYVLSGAPRTSSLYSGLKIQAKPEFSILDDGHIMMKVRSPKIMTFNGTWPVQDFKDAPHLERTLGPLIETPVKFEYSEGLVGEIKAPASLPDNVVNIHRGIINFLQLTTDVVAKDYYFKLQQMDIVGICETAYTAFDISPGVVRAVKTKNYENCIERPAIYQNIFRANQYHTDQVPALHSGAVFTYNLTEKGDTMIIRDAYSQEHNVFSPYAEQEGAVESIIRQRLQLVDQTAKADSWEPTSGNIIDRGSLMYKFPEDSTGQRNEHPHGISIAEISAVMETIMGEMTFDYITSSVAGHWIQMTKYLRQANYEVLMKVWENYSDKPSSRKFLIDTLPIVGTEAAIDALHDIIKAEPAIIREHTSCIFTGLAFPIAPTKEYVKKAKILIEDPIVQNYYPARRAALLAYGGIVHNYCHNKTKCIPELYDFLIAKYNNAPNDTEKEIVLKAMGNAGMVVAPFIRKLFKEPEKMSIRIQVAALQALRRLALTDPVRARAILLPIYLDPSYDPEVRITTCKLLFDTKPSVATLTILAQQLNTEPSNQVVSFVYSHLIALANSTAPANLPLARAAKMALHFARLRSGLTLRYSKAYHVSAYYDNLRMGGYMHFDMIKNTDSFVPKQVNSKINLNIHGYSFDMIDIGIRGEGLQKLIEHITEPQSMLRRYTTLSDLIQKRRTQRREEEPSYTESYERKLYKYKPIEEEDSDYLGTIYIRIFDTELYVFDVNKTMVTDIVKSGSFGLDLETIERKLSEGLSYKWLKVMPMFESVTAIPTIIGLPVNLNITSSWVGTLKTDTNVRLIRNPDESFETSAEGHVGAGQTSGAYNYNKSPESKASGSKTEAESSEESWWSREVEKFRHSKEVQYETDRRYRSSEEQSGKSYRSESESKERRMRRMRAYSSEPLRGVKAEAKVILNNAMMVHVAMGVDAILIQTGVGIAVKQRSILPIAGEVGVDLTQRQYYLTAKPVSKPFEAFILSADLFTFSKSPRELNGNTTIISPPRTPMTDSPFVKKTQMCVPFLEEIVGAEICCNMEYVPRAGFANSPYLPLNGPIRIAASWIPEAVPPQKVKISLTNREPFSWESIKRGKLDSILEIQTIGGQRQSDVEVALTYNDQAGKKVIELSADVKQEERQKMRLTYTSQDVYRQAELLVAMGRNYEEYTMKNTYLVEKTPQIKLNIKSTINSIPERLVPALEMIKMYLETYVYLYDIAEVSMESNAARTLETNLILRSPDILDVQVKLPGVTMIRRRMRLPVPITEVPGPQTHIMRNVVDTMKNVIQSQYATCKVLNNQYVTYDNVAYHYQPPGDCYHVLTKDGAERGKFMVLMSRYEKDPTRKIIKIHVGNKNVKLLPDMTVEVNDRKVNVHENQKYESEREFSIYKYPQNITFEAYIGLHIVYTGENIFISVQPIYHARTVGLCGNDDDEQIDEFVLPDHSVVSDPTVFAHSWIIKGESCSDVKACKLAPKYKIISEYVNDEYQKCFSTVPVSHCLRGCEPRETNTVTVGFHCVPAEYSSVSDTEQMIMSGQTEHLNLASKSIDIYRMVEADVACDCDRCPNLPRPYY